MTSRSALPAQRNPLVAPENSPSLEILIERRRLGQTQLNIKAPNFVNGAEKGTFDYAHLRVPLPKDLTGSEIFALKNMSAYPESYFLMRRSSDGYISATGMFKAAFPWASHNEEDAERKYHKTFSTAGNEEVAGSVWLAPEDVLSEEYGMRQWIDALLDPTPIEKGNKDKQTTHIQMPPKFDPRRVPSASFSAQAPNLRASTRARSTRSASPSKIATPHKMATPRKPRAKKLSEVVQTEMEITETKAATSSLQNVLENGTTASESVASEPANGEAREPETVRIEIQETVETDGDIETKTTNVKVDVPADHPELREPENPTDLIAEAQKMVDAARQLDGGESSKQGKRKADELGEDEVDARSKRPAKLARTQSTLEQKLAKEKITRRALVGVTVMAAITTAVSYFAGFAA
ncbi:apses transcription factor-like protein [Bimuria novae-zelandiae CBS 107.79]|uniref:Apses transcription factor-like protein n=1 Tax=Bimuria novae-zelandiae CBS 107.79 TaxID=1447943 RepID=A0A6A5UKX6_9PLEO|nr:apses transcription factor-like protein [Bimuria novae-zelandiae CBS 107.79]